MEILQADECYSFCRITQRSPHGLWGLFVARSTIEKSFRHLFNIWGEYPNSVHCQFISFESSGVVFAWQREIGLDEETSNFFNLFIQKTGGTDPANFWGLSMEDYAAVEDIVQVDFFLYDIDTVHGSMNHELARMNVRNHSNTVRLLCYISHICHVSITSALFKAYRCPLSD